MPSVTLFNAQQGNVALRKAWDWCKPRLIAGHRLVLTVKAEKRTRPQNDLVHPVVREIAVAAERPTDAESLRVLRYLLLEQWRADTRRPPDYERSLDGLRMVNVSKGTSDLDKPDCSEFIDWLHAWAAQHGVTSAETDS